MPSLRLRPALDQGPGATERRAESTPTRKKAAASVAVHAAAADAAAVLVRRRRRRHCRCRRLLRSPSSGSRHLHLPRKMTRRSGQERTNGAALAPAVLPTLLLPLLSSSTSTATNHRRRPAFFYFDAVAVVVPPPSSSPLSLSRPFPVSLSLCESRDAKRTPGPTARVEQARSGTKKRGSKGEKRAQMKKKGREKNC